LEEFSDVQLIEKYLSGDCGAFDILYDKYKKQLYSYLNRLLPQQAAQIDDIFQQTWIRVIKKLPMYNDKQKFLAWIMRISHNLTIDYFRKSKNELLTEKSDDNILFSSDESQPWMGMDRAELSLALDKGIAELNSEQREVFLLRQEDISFNEIAEIQGVSINTALGRMQYAIKKLQKHLKEWKRIIDER
jgi:RNA polymerase sigma-70 factor, ECF subfamily